MLSAFIALIMGLVGGFTAQTFHAPQLFGATSVFSVFQGGTGVGTFSQGLVYSPGGTTALTSTTSPIVGYITATSTHTSTFPNATTTLLTISTAWIPSLGIGAGTLLAVDPTGKIIATSTSAGTVSSITAGLGLNGGIITTSGTLSLKSYTATSTADTTGQILVFTSTNATPATYGGDSDLTFTNGNLMTATNASTTALTVGTFLTIPNSSSQAPLLAGQLALDTTNDQLVIGDGSTTSVFDKRRLLTLAYATSTTWTGTTTLPTFVIPMGLTWNTITCITAPAGATLNAQYQYANSSTYATVNATMVPASSTPGIITFSSNNTPTAQATSTISFGTPASTPTGVSCSLTGVATGT